VTQSSLTVLTITRTGGSCYGTCFTGFA
jgi:hypothetical protein